MLRHLTIQLICVFVCCLEASSADEAIQLLPQPSTISISEADGFVIGEKLVVACPKAIGFKRHIELFGELVQRNEGVSVLFDEADPNIRIVTEEFANKEQYQIEVDSSKIIVKVAGLKSLARATSTLLQLFGQHKNRTIPALTIKDSPSSEYRNVMLDLGRNPHSLECLRETVNLLWYYKVDSLQLHLTDDQRFAFPSKAFPKLQTQDDQKISWDQFKELERYAFERGVTIIPELDIPGHSSMLRRIYPEVFGKSEKELAELESSRKGIKTLLKEMMEVFSSTPWIHIGGDEASGVPEESQRELINDLHQWLKDHDRKTLVWEGPSRGTGGNRVHPDVIHINWRTINYPADQMLNDGHPVVNAAWDPLYVVDHYPRTNFTMTTPEYIFENLDRYRFAHVNPGIPTFAKPIRVTPTPNIIGYCMPWWEGREENLRSMMYPRIVALADVAWNDEPRSATESELKRKFVDSIFRRYFCPIKLNVSDLAIKPDNVFQDQLNISLTAETAGKVHYTVDGSRPRADTPVFSNSIQIKKSTTFRAALFDDAGNQIGDSIWENFVGVDTSKINSRNVAFGKPVSSSVSSAAPFSVGRVTDGSAKALDYYLGYPSMPKPIELTIDLGELKPINQIIVHAANVSGSYESYEALLSVDGTSFKTVATRRDKPKQNGPKSVHQFDSQKARYVQIKTWGNKGYVFDSFSKITEVEVLSAN
jgi:hexosaminidase